MSDYNAWYTKGWTAAQRSADLDAAEGRFLERTGEPWNGAAHRAFEDGWLDLAAGRDKYHLRDCTDHDNCDRVNDLDRFNDNLDVNVIEPGPTA